MASFWRETFDPKARGVNVAAGVVVAMVALPLNLALAVACGLPPAAGLLSGAIGGLVCGLLGSSRLNITGPEVALAPMTGLIVAQHGVSGLAAATALAGLMQIAFGVLRVGNVVRMLPRPVVGGFLAAVGVMVLDTQIPHVLGIHDGAGIVDAFGHVALGSVGLPDLALGLGVSAVLVAGRSFAPKVPAPLLALALAVGAAWWLGLDVARLEPVSSGAMTLGLPALGGVDWAAIFPSALALAALASVDSLVCAVSVDSRSGQTPHDPGRELIAQGFANLACAAVGGMPVAAAVVRSVAAIEAGATTRLAGLVQSVVLLAVLLVLGPYLDRVPLAALSGVLLVVGAKLIDLREIASVARLRRLDGAIFLATAAGILVLGFVEGLLLGAGLAGMDLARSSARQLRAEAGTDGTRRWLRVGGPIVFASQSQLAGLLGGVAEGEREVSVDLSGVTAWDASGVAALRQWALSVAPRARVEIHAGTALPVALLSRELGETVKVHGAPSREERELSAAPSFALDGAE